MAQSYIPAGTDVICTEMLSTLPSQIITEREAKVLYGKESKALLNTCDKNLSCQFQCRIKQSFFSGLGGLLAGLALGALAVGLVIATAGAAAPLVAAAATAAATTAYYTSGVLIAGGVASFIISKNLANECNKSFSKEWEMVHERVKIEKYKALLERSILPCNKGGVVSLVMDHAKAVELAKMISDANNSILTINTCSKFTQGFIGAAANAFKAEGLSDVCGLIISSSLAIYDHVKHGYKDNNTKNQQKYAYETLSNRQAELLADGELWTSENTRDTGLSIYQTTFEGVMPVIDSNRETFKTMCLWFRDEMTKGNGLTRAFWRYFAGQKAKDISKEIGGELFTINNVQKLGFGIVSSVISNGIEWSSNKDENDLYRSMMQEINSLRGEKGINTSNILAQLL